MTTQPNMPPLNTWWLRLCNQKRYFLRDTDSVFGKPFVWIYEEGVNRCYHLPLATLLKRYRQLPVPPCDPGTRSVIYRLNRTARREGGLRPQGLAPSFSWS